MTFDISDPYLKLKLFTLCCYDMWYIISYITLGIDNTIVMNTALFVTMKYSIYAGNVKVNIKLRSQ